jgi:hypothetical protein
MIEILLYGWLNKKKKKTHALVEMGKSIFIAGGATNESKKSHKSNQSNIGYYERINTQ